VDRQQLLPGDPRVDTILATVNPVAHARLFHALLLAAPGLDDRYWPALAALLVSDEPRVTDVIDHWSALLPWRTHRDALTSLLPSVRDARIADNFRLFLRLPHKSTAPYWEGETDEEEASSAE
jgi:hypothetical protein